jgi:hypothetical protein
MSWPVNLIFIGKSRWSQLASNNKKAPRDSPEALMKLFRKWSVPLPVVLLHVGVAPSSGLLPTWPITWARSATRRFTSRKVGVAHFARLLPSNSPTG